MAETLDRVAEIEKLGVRVFRGTVWEDRGEGRQQYDVPEVVTGINPNFTPTQWVAMTQREGAAYVGGCCGNMGAVQDIANSAYRDSGFFESSDLITMGQYSRGHEGMEGFAKMTDEEFTEKIQAVLAVRDKILEERGEEESDTIIDPWAVLGLAYSATEGKLKPGWLNQPSGRHGRDEDPPDHYEMQQLYRNLAYVDWGDLFTGSSTREDHDVQRRLHQARILPAARGLVAKLEAQEIDFDGYALVRPGTDEVLSNRLGDCIYPDRAGAEAVLEVWQRAAESEEEGTTGHATVTQDEGEIVPIRVTVENGLEVLRG